jgi:hypothetical protein
VVIEDLAAARVQVGDAGGITPKIDRKGNARGSGLGS